MMPNIGSIPPKEEPFTGCWKPLAQEKVAHNIRQIQHNRHMAAIVAGAFAGILGLENLSGLAVYAIMTLLGSLLIVAESKFRVGDYFANRWEPLTGSLFSGFLTFVLSWTLVYNAVYVF